MRRADLVQCRTADHAHARTGAGHGISGIKAEHLLHPSSGGHRGGRPQQRDPQPVAAHRKRVLLGYMGFGVLATVLHYLRIYQSAGIGNDQAS